MAYIQSYEGKNGISYQVKWRVNGKGKSKTFSSKREANTFKKEIEAELTLGLAKDNSRITLQDYSKDFFEIHVLDLKPNTIDNYKGNMIRINKELGKTKLVDLTPKQLDKYFLKLKTKNKLKMNSIKKYRDVLNLVLSDAFKKDIIPINPLDKLAFKFIDHDEPGKKIATIEELNFILDTFQVPYFKHLLLLGIMTGMRKGEMLALQWKEHIDFDNRIIKVKGSLDKYGNISTPKTKSSIRDIYMHDNLKLLLQSIKDYQKEMKEFFGKQYIDNDLVICKQNGEYLKTNQVSRRMNDKKHVHGVHVTIRMLRTTFATWLRGVEAKDVQKLLGHANVDITLNTYQQHDQFKSESLDKINEIFSDRLHQNKNNK
jgi:integrase